MEAVRIDTKAYHCDLGRPPLSKDSGSGPASSKPRHIFRVSEEIALVHRTEALIKQELVRRRIGSISLLVNPDSAERFRD